MKGRPVPLFSKPLQTPATLRAKATVGRHVSVTQKGVTYQGIVVESEPEYFIIGNPENPKYSPEQHIFYYRNYNDIVINPTQL